MYILCYSFVIVAVIFFPLQSSGNAQAFQYYHHGKWFSLSSGWRYGKDTKSENFKKEKELY